MSSAPNSTPLAAALAYAHRGWHVFPCHTPQFLTTTVHCSCPDPKCSTIGKHPRTKHGFKDATTDAATIRAWWSRWPEANIGIATGAPSQLGPAGAFKQKGTVSLCMNLIVIFCTGFLVDLWLKRAPEHAIRRKSVP